MGPAVMLYGVLLPILFGWCAHRTHTHGFSLALAFVYNVVRIGPHFMNFAYVYTLCHKEGHSRVGMWRAPYSTLLGNVFNYYIGLFYGVLPSTFAVGHTRNHHTYNNEQQSQRQKWPMVKAIGNKEA